MVWGEGNLVLVFIGAKCVWWEGGLVLVFIGAKGLSLLFA